MAINICSETSPRISFSNDLCPADVAPIDNCKSRNSELPVLDSGSDFDFCVSTSFEHESSSADQLFSNGIILPIKFQERTVAPRSAASLPPLPAPCINDGLKKESSKGIVISSSESQEKLQSSSKSFWPFKRSSSLNCDNVNRRSLMCSLPLLSRSNSTGSEPNSKRTPKQNSQKQPLMGKSSSSTSSSTNFYTYPVSQKPPLKKNYGGSYGNGVWISPVINVPPAYISKGTANLFGLGSLFRNGKDKKSKKWHWNLALKDN